MLLAHGVGTRSDLPIPTSLAATGAGLALLISFVALAALWREPRFSGGSGRPVPPAVGAALASRTLRAVARIAALLATVLVCLVGLFGPTETERNLAPWALYVTFWVGLVPASLLLGPVWRAANPLRLLHGILGRLLRLDRERGRYRLPERTGYWPAACSLLVFGWFELVNPAGSDPRHVAGFVLGYGLIHTVAALAFGRRWFDHGDGFEVYSTLLGSLAPLGRRDDGRFVLRSPLDGLKAVREAPGLVAVLVVLVGQTAFDGLSGTLWWQTTVPTVDTPDATIMLLVVIGLVAGIYLAGTYSLVAPGAFAHTLVPIAAGYAIAHYFSLLVFDGQQTFVLLSDPFATGADILDTAGRAVDYTLVGTTAIGLVQVGAIVAGHLLAAVSAHDRAVRLFSGRAALRVQYPLLAAMVGLTVGAVGLVFAP